MPDQVTSRELDLIIKEMERQDQCHRDIVKTILNRAIIIWLISGAFGYTTVVLALMLKLHLGV